MVPPVRLVDTIVPRSTGVSRWDGRRGTWIPGIQHKNGTPTHELQRLGGWKTGAMVERYAHVAPAALQGAASRLDVFSGYAAATDKQKGPGS